IFMSNSEDSTVTYTGVSSPFEDILEHLPSPAPEFVLENVYPEFMPLEDDVLPAEEQPLHAAVSPTADSPRYILESNLENGLEEDPEEDDEDPKEDPADYPTDREDDNEEEESSGEDSGCSRGYITALKEVCIALGLRFEVGESSSAPTTRPIGGFRADYRFVGTLDDEIRQDTDKIYGRLDDAQDDRLLMSSQLNMLRRDRRAHAQTARLMKSEARLSHEAWVPSMDASNTAHAKVMSLHTIVLAQQTEIAGLLAAGST
nr:hypothetical protein [Tanacetum cinerariifolium]